MRRQQEAYRAILTQLSFRNIPEIPPVDLGRTSPAEPGTDMADAYFLMTETALDMLVTVIDLDLVTTTTLDWGQR